MKVVVVTGAGGVGKTTLSAALAVRAASAGRRCLVLTVDPAHRLADALGVGGVGNEPTAVGSVPGLWAAMLDTTASWEAVVRRYAEPEVARRLVRDPFFRAIADRFPAAQAFAAAEETASRVESGNWDLLVVDTPPAGGGIDFFLAPRRTADLVGGRLLRWLTGAGLPGRRALYRIAARPVLRIADTVLGGRLLEEVADFLLDLRTLHDDLSHRAKVIERHLRSATTLVVTTADPTPMREARRFFEELPEARVRPAAVVFNRALPDAWAEAAQRPLRGIPEAEVRAVLKANLRRWAGEVQRQAGAREELAARYRVPLATVPWVLREPTSVAALAALLEGADGLAAIVG